MGKPIINVLLSTYNGEDYLQEQLDSVINQEGVVTKIFIRDDGSVDKTLDILKENRRRFSNIEIIRGENIGCKHSFFELMRLCYNKDVEYYAFCDQDDIWDNNKLIEAIKKIRDFNNIPILYCSNLKVVDSRLKFLRLMNEEKIDITKNSTLLQNIVTGCTCVINKQLLELFLSGPSPSGAVMHDWWLYCLASYFGTVIYDDRAFINYRQHEHNVYGARTKNLWQRFSNFLCSYANNEKEHYREIQAKEFYHQYLSKLSLYDAEMVRRIAFYRSSLRNRIKLAFDFHSFPRLGMRLRIRILAGLV